jgi:hypothetical protein
MEPNDNLDNIHDEELLREQMRMLRRLDERIRLQYVGVSENLYQGIVAVEDINVPIGNMF